VFAGAIDVFEVSVDAEVESLVVVVFVLSLLLQDIKMAAANRQSSVGKRFMYFVDF
jgi:hypothetical protein